MLQILPELPSYLDFSPVVEQQVRNGREVANHFWTINPLTDAVIGTSKTRHKPRNFVEMWERLDAGLASSDLVTAEPKVLIIHGKDGASMRANILLKKYDYEPIIGEPTSLQISIKDSHNQTVQRVVKAMLYRLFCKNGQSSVRENIGYSQKHTKNGDPIKLGEVASKWPEKLIKEANLHVTMQKISAPEETALDFFKKTVALSRSITGEKVNKVALEEAMQLWHGYRQLGSNVFRIYNVLTHIGTHVVSKTKGTNLHRKMEREEQRIEEILRGNDFQQLLAA